ncbi:ankyrin repeat domain-containing protein [Streptomyces sp. NRRL S-448]|uniref:ankyrin repeat domain-containing protein n=1 Tax=Streptomyces sp. NRRL S-448 TaxID=1463907 RepID=UPI0035621F34
MTAAERPEGDWSGEGRSDHYNPLVNGLGRAAESGDTTLVQRLLAGGAEPDAYVIGGRRALDLAVCAGHAEIVRLLLAAGADPRLDAGAYDEATPMCLAAMHGDTDIARALLDAGAPPGGPAGRMRYVPLVLAARCRDREHTELVDLLLDRGADIEEQMRDCTVLDWSARFGYPALVELLLTRGAAPTERTFREGTAGQWITARRGPFSHDPDYKAVRTLLVAAWEARN